MSTKKNKLKDPMRIEVTCPRDEDSEYWWPDPDKAKYFVIPESSIEGARGAKCIDGLLEKAHEEYEVAVEELGYELASEEGKSIGRCTWANAHDRVVEAARELGRQEGMNQLAAEYRGELRGMNRKFWMDSRDKDVCRTIEYAFSVGIMTRMLKRGVSLSRFADALKMRRKEALRRLRGGQFDVNQVGRMTRLLDWDVGQVFGRISTRLRSRRTNEQNPAA